MVRPAGRSPLTIRSHSASTAKAIHLRAEKAARFIERETGRKHRAFTALGSGLSHWAAKQKGAVEIPVDKIPHFPKPSVAGHAGRLFSIEVNGHAQLVSAGRIHSYEAATGALDKVTFAVETAIHSGCKRVFLTNAAGSVNAAYEPGQFVLIKDHLNMTGLSRFVGQVQPGFADFINQSEVYSEKLRQHIANLANAGGIALVEGVYACMRGRTYETPAEIRMLRALGADMVGMSTIFEATTAYALQAQVLGLSLITNKGAGITKGAILSHEEVQETSAKQEKTFARLMDIILPELNPSEEETAPDSVPELHSHQSPEAMKALLDRKISSLGLPNRIIKLLKESPYKMDYLGDLVINLSPAQLFNRRGFGRRAYSIINAKLLELQLHLEMDIDDWERPQPSQEILDKKIADTGLPARAIQLLKEKHVEYIGDLVQKHVTDLHKIPLFGLETIHKVEAMLKEMDLELGMCLTDIWTRPFAPPFLNI